MAQLKSFVEQEATHLGSERNDQRNIIIPFSIHFAKYKTEEQTDQTSEWFQHSEWYYAQIQTRRMKE